MRSPQKILLLLLIVLATAGFFYWLFHSGSENAPKQPNLSESTPDSTESSSPGAISSPGTPQPSGASSSQSRAAATGAVPPFAPVPPPAPAIPYVLGSPSAPLPMEPSIVLGNMRIAIANYGSRYGGNPVGINREITSALNGDNPNGAKFITEESGLRINGQGELVDYWGTPFFFHQLSANVTEIRSAGPDRQMYTADDLVTK